MEKMQVINENFKAKLTLWFNDKNFYETQFGEIKTWNLEDLNHRKYSVIVKLIQIWNEENYLYQLQKLAQHYVVDDGEFFCNGLKYMDKANVIFPEEVIDIIKEKLELIFEYCMRDEIFMMIETDTESEKRKTCTHILARGKNEGKECSIACVKKYCKNHALRLRNESIKLSKEIIKFFRMYVWVK